MRKWLYDRPWIWVVLLLGSMVLSGLAVVVIAQLNRPVIVKQDRPKRLSLNLDPEDFDLQWNVPDGSDRVRRSASGGNRGGAAPGPLSYRV